MLKIIKKILKTGITTEKLAPATPGSFEEIGLACQKIIKAKLNGSLAIRHVDAGSCNGCELEIHALNNPIYNIEQFGINFVASPRHADMLLVTGPVSRHMEHALKQAYDSTPAPKLVIALGDCAIDGGKFGVSYASLGAVANAIPVNAIIKGCPPTPTDILQAILAALK
jgi:Ni,Fe-hydrogenase III small subunit